MQVMVPHLLNRIPHLAQSFPTPTVVSAATICSLEFIYITVLIHLFDSFSSDDSYHGEEGPPAFCDNQDFGIGLDNKSIRRAFIRKVKHCQKNLFKST